MNFNDIIDKKVRIRSNFSGHNLPVGTLLIIKTHRGSGRYNTEFVPGDLNTYYGSTDNIHLQDFDIIENILNESDEKNLEKLNPVPEVKDEYGLNCAIILRDDEETIYLSSGTRSIMKLKEGDKINIAVNFNADEAYICKELDSEEGLIIADDFTVKSSDMYRHLADMFERNELGISTKRIKDKDFQDYTFYKIGVYNPNQFPIIKTNSKIINKKGEMDEYQEITDASIKSIVEKTVANKKEKPLANGKKSATWYDTIYGSSQNNNASKTFIGSSEYGVIIDQLVSTEEIDQPTTSIELED